MEEWNDINGTKQYIKVLQKKKDAPILIYLHGGPGDAALPLVERMNAELAERYTLVIWEQRGAGKSYYPFSEEEITIDDFLQDLDALVDLLLSSFEQEKLCLMGHSWGSILGLMYIQQHPEKVQCYIGVGQVVCPQKMFEKSKEFLAEHLANSKMAQKIATIDTRFISKDWYADLLLLTGQLMQAGVSFYGKKSYISMYPHFLFSKEYTLKDCINRVKGAKQSLHKLWHQVMAVDFSEQTIFSVPIVLIEGAMDYQVSEELAYEFYQKIQSPKRYFRLNEAAHFPQWCRPDTFNQLVCSLDLDLSDSMEQLDM